MPEALAVVAVVAVSLLAWIGAWLQARDPARAQPGEERARLEQQVRWLAERLERARRENWGADLEAGLRAELDATRARLAGLATA